MSPWQHWFSPATPPLAFIIALLLTVSRVSAADAQQEAPGPSIVGIDHIPVGVRDLEQASDAYRRFGFTLKPGRLHEDGIRNNHVKFKDGSGIELLAPPGKSVDTLTEKYLHHIEKGDGPAYVSFHARDTNKLIAALDSSGLEFKQDGFITLTDPSLDFVFFDQDNRSPTDKPEHFSHPNSAAAMTGVWLALDDRARASLTKLFLSLGAQMHEEVVAAPTLTRASVFTVQNGRVVVLPKSQQWVDGRPVIGAVFQVRDFTTAARYLGTRTELHLPGGTATAGQRCLVIPPTLAHGLWLEFCEN